MQFAVWLSRSRLKTESRSKLRYEISRIKWRHSASSFRPGGNIWSAPAPTRISPPINIQRTMSNQTRPTIYIYDHSMVSPRTSKWIRSCLYYPSPVKTQGTDPEVEIKFEKSVLANAQIQTNSTPRAADFGREPYFSRKFSVASTKKGVMLMHARCKECRSRLTSLKRWFRESHTCWVSICF